MMAVIFVSAALLALVPSDAAGTFLSHRRSFVGLNATGKKNVLGTDLASCSSAGTAMTGFTRDGHCIDEGNDDAGSHHICVHMKKDFCTVTGQPDWCEIYK